MWRNWKQCTLLMGMSNGSALVEPKTVWLFLKKLNVELPCDPTIPLLDISLRKLETGSETSTHVHNSTNHDSQKMETA